MQLHSLPNPSLPLQELVLIRISIAEIVCGASKMSGCQEKSENKNKYKYILYQIPVYHYRKSLLLEFQLPILSV